MVIACEGMSEVGHQHTAVDDTEEQMEKDTGRAAPAKPVAAFVDRVAGNAMSIFVDALVVLVLVALAWTVWLVGVDLYQGMTGAVEYEVKNLFIEILTIFIFIEIFHSLLGYLRDQRISITNLADVSLAIVFRELWIGLFGLQLSWPMVMAFAVVIVAIGGVRVFITYFGGPDRTLTTPLSDAEDQ